MDYSTSVITALRESLGLRLLAYCMNIEDPGLVQSYESGAELPNEEARAKFVKLLQGVVHPVQRAEDSAPVLSWMQASFPELGNRTPAAAFRSGDEDRVIEYAHAHAREPPPRLTQR